MKKLRFSLDEENLRKLLSGRVVELDGGAIEIALSDIGLERLLVFVGEQIRRTMDTAVIEEIRKVLKRRRRVASSDQEGCQSDAESPAGHGVPRHDFNGLTEAQAEALAHLVEECGEVIACIGKVLRHGLHSHNPAMPRDGSNIDQLSFELGDLEAAVAIAVRHRCAHRAGIEEGRNQKLQKVGRYLHHASLRGMRGAPDSES